MSASFRSRCPNVNWPLADRVFGTGVEATARRQLRECVQFLRDNAQYLSAEDCEQLAQLLPPRTQERT